MSILTLAAGAVGITGIGAALIFIPGAAAAVAKLAGAAVSFIVALPWAKIWWVIPLGAAIIFGLIERGEARHWQKTDAGHVATIAADVQAMKTMRTSLDGALGAINDNNRRIDAANKALQAARQEAAAADARSNARYGPTGAAVKRLEQSAGAKGLPACVVSDEARKALEGL